MSNKIPNNVTTRLFFEKVPRAPKQKIVEILEDVSKTAATILELKKALENAQEKFGQLIERKWDLANKINELENKNDEESNKLRESYQQQLEKIRVAEKESKIEQLIYEKTSELNRLMNPQAGTPVPTP